jgi:hypothetical protein
MKPSSEAWQQRIRIVIEARRSSAFRKRQKYMR